MKIVSLIPARGGSKGLPRKNILDLAGKPLIAWSIEASLHSKYINKTFVSSEDQEILKIAKDFKSEIVTRPDALAQDTTLTEPVIEHFLNSLNSEEKFDYLVLLQPTSPLRDCVDIDKAIEVLRNSEATSLISVVAIDNKILKAFKENSEGYLEGVSNNTFPFMRRQDLPKVFMPNGAIYIVKVDDFLKSSRLFTDKCKYFVMSEEKSTDIDILEDLKKVEKIINYDKK